MGREAICIVLATWLLSVSTQALAAGLEPALEQSAQLRSEGRYRDAREVLATAEHDSLTPDRQAALLRELGLVDWGQGQFSEALERLKEAGRLANQSGELLLEAAILNDLGMVHAGRGERTEARSAFFEAARRTGDDEPALSATIALNHARLALAAGDISSIEDHAGIAGRAAASLPMGTRRANLQLGIGSVYAEAMRRHGLDASWRRLAWEQFESGRASAETVGDSRLQSFALGFIGGLYEDELRYEEALAYSRRAAFLAQSSGSDDSLYRWQWQSARVLRETGDIESAIVAYHQSIDTLGRLRPELGMGESASFRERAAPVFFELADLLLRRTATLTGDAEIEANLREVRSTLEQVKVAEVQEYFEDQCVSATGGETDLDAVGLHSAVIYPILLPDRTELLVSLPGRMRQYTVPVGSARLTEEVRLFREQIERFDGRQDYLRHAEQLYRWLVAPMESELAEADITTLVFVPDGPLRTIPMSALHDGQRYLVERFAFATTPGLTLTSPRALERDRVEMFAGGLTEGVQGFSPLPNVGQELASISQQFPALTIQDEQFVVEEVGRQISEGDQAIVHIATHGQFDSDHTKSFLLAYDDKITMDRLQATISGRQYQDDPLELLVLSACQTAAGDDKAALGLAGVALQAGARSALATLWFVNDESTARMIEDFYVHLGDPANSKAEALQLAQKQLLQEQRFRHPSFWAPFLLIGNWL